MHNPFFDRQKTPQTRPKVKYNRGMDKTGITNQRKLGNPGLEAPKGYQFTSSLFTFDPFGSSMLFVRRHLTRIQQTPHKRSNLRMYWCKLALGTGLKLEVSRRRETLRGGAFVCIPRSGGSIPLLFEHSSLLLSFLPFEPLIYFYLYYPPSLKVEVASL